MKFILLTALHLLPCLLFGQRTTCLPDFFDYSAPDTIALALSEEDQILQKIELGVPGEPYVKNGEKWISLLGAWCTVSYDSAQWTLIKTNTYAPGLGCNGVAFSVGGNLFDIRNGVLRQRNRIAHSTNGDTIQFHVVDSIGQTQIYSWVLISGTESELHLQKSTPLETTEPGKQSFSSFFGSEDYLKTVSREMNGKTISYNRQTCSLECIDASGKTQWRKELSEEDGKLMFLTELDSKLQHCDRIFQLEDKRIFLLDSRTGKIRSAKAKRFD